MFDQESEGEEYSESEEEEGKERVSKGLGKLAEFGRRHGVKLGKEAKKSNWIELDAEGYEDEEELIAMLEEFDKSKVVKIKMEGGRALVQLRTQEEAKAKVEALSGWGEARLVKVE